MHIETSQVAIGFSAITLVWMVALTVIVCQQTSMMRSFVLPMQPAPPGQMHAARARRSFGSLIRAAADTVTLGFNGPVNQLPPTGTQRHMVNALNREILQDLPNDPDHQRLLLAAFRRPNQSAYKPIGLLDGPRQNLGMSGWQCGAD